MKTIRISNEKDIQQTQDTVLVLGYFDGLHRGHQALFAEARQIAAEKKLKIAVLTFPESPKLAFVRYQPDLLLHLNSPEEREQLLEAQGVDYLYLIDFTSCFAGNKAEDFFEKYVKRLKAKAVVAGFDYHFGSDKKEAKELSQYFDGQIVIVSSVNEDAEKISSTRIRQEIKEGRVAEARRLLGYPLSTRGIVVHGNARGRTIGYPTANLAPLDRVFLATVFMSLKLNIMVDVTKGWLVSARMLLLKAMNFGLKQIFLIFQRIYMETRFGYTGWIKFVTW